MAQATKERYRGLHQRRRQQASEAESEMEGRMTRIRNEQADIQEQCAQEGVALLVRPPLVCKLHPVSSEATGKMLRILFCFSVCSLCECCLKFIEFSRAGSDVSKFTSMREQATVGSALKDFPFGVLHPQRLRILTFEV